MFGIGGFELFLIIVFAFVVFGPKKLPDVIKIAGLCVKKFRKAKSEMDKVLQEEIVDPVMKVANEPDKPKSDSKPNSSNSEKNTNSEKNINKPEQLKLPSKDKEVK